MGKDDDRRLEIAAFRYRLIADAKEGLSGGVTAAIAEAVKEPHVDLDGSPFTVEERTLWRHLAAYNRGGLLALAPKIRKDRGSIRAISAELLERAAQLRREEDTRATTTIIDILVRSGAAKVGQIAPSTLNRHFDRLGLARRQRARLGAKTYRKVLTEAPFELVLADFHHGPYVRVGEDSSARKALLLAFIDHFSRYVFDARYYLHEDFVVLRYAFRRVLTAFGRFQRLYIDNGPSFQTARFHAASKHEAIDIDVVHSKPYVSEGRGCCERFNGTVKRQFENEVRGRDELLTLDQLNSYFAAWLAERYHKDVNSETNEAPRERFTRVEARLRAAPDLSLVDELLRLREGRTVHRKWSTVEANGTRYVVDPALRGRRVKVLHDPLDLAYVLIEHDGRTIQRATPQRPGEQPPPLPQDPGPKAPKTDYLELLQRDHKAAEQAQLTNLRLRTSAPRPELTLVDLVALLESCRGAVLSLPERNEAGDVFRKMRPIEPDLAQKALASAQRRLGTQLHVRVYLDALETALVRQRTKGATKP